MALGYPTTSDSYESQQFGPVPYGIPGYFSQPAMYASGSTVAWYQPYKAWTYYAHYHNGLDIAGAEGLALRALESGKVIFKGWRDNGGGYVLEVEIRPGTRYSFNHCDGFPPLQVGQRVARGQVVAFMGSSGAATGNHCHASLDIAERGPDGVTRWLAWNPRYFMAGGPYADDPRIVPLSYVPPTAPIVYPSTEGDNIMALRYLYDSGSITIRAGKPYRDGPSVNAKILGYFPKDTIVRKIGKPKRLTGSYDPWHLSDIYRGNGYGLIWVTAVDRA